jgi:phosphate transport system substrate-binding protein
MKKIIMLAALMVMALGVGQSFAGVVLNGAGATFPYPLYSKWFYSYEKETGVKINYQSIGSGGGIAQVKAGTVDFGASDAPLKGEQLREAGLFQFPMVAGVVAVVYNVPGVDKGLKLSSKVIADIYMGKVRKWDDPAITGDNPGVNLPSLPIVVAHRSDGSGTTNIFTWYLSDVSTDWKVRAGSGTAVSWPAGIGGKGNEGVAGIVRQTRGAIGYVELAYAQQNKIPFAMVGNRDGNFVYPSDETCKAAASNAYVPDDFYTKFTYASGKNSYPIAGFTFILVHKKQKDPAKWQALMNFVEWAYKNGDKDASELDYVPLPAKLKNRVKSALAREVH